HAELRRRVGEPQIARPGKRIEAIAAVERHLGLHPDDKDAWGLKRLLYRDVKEEDYRAAAGDRPSVPHFDHAFVQQLGLALINDAERWPRGCEHLRMAAHGLPAMAPTIYIQIAKAYDRAGKPDEAWESYAQVKHAGVAFGAKNLTEEDRHAFYAVVKMLGDEAMRQGNTDQAIEDFRIYSEYERAGIETMRNLAALYEGKGDALAALHFTEMGLVYNAKDKDLLERRDKYYY